MSRRYEPWKSPAPAHSRQREDAFREQLRAARRHDHEPQGSPSLASTGGRAETSRDQSQAPGGFESRRPSAITRDARRPPTRAERRLARFGPGDTAPGGIPRSEVEVEENGKLLKGASRQLRIAAKLRQVADLSEPGLADEHEFVRDEPPRRTTAGERDLSGRKYEDSWRVKENIPLSIPYTTPASEFLYGTSVIFAALTAMRRKMYKLYVYGGENREAGVQDKSIQDLARDRKVKVIQVDGEWLRLMDKLSTGRPHNVCQPA